jgi:hypothetical protein
MENLGNKTEKYLKRMLSQSSSQRAEVNQNKVDELEAKNIDVSVSSILNEKEDDDEQKVNISDADNERMYINNIRWIVMNHIDINICEEM